ncbi:MAG: ABC transporter ATP-binding protein [Planctomycetales bacterium]|nr:ABC transporter ATP-binding protein [Planctomycetales bacterium]
MIEMRNITKRFGRFVALSEVSLAVSPGEAVALWGPNGAGKSTLVRCLLGLVPFRGHASVGGLDVRGHGKAARRLIGYLPQEPALFDDLRVAEVAVLFARLKRARVADARRMLSEIGLASHARKRVSHLSGGMKQRLSLGLALLNDPPAIVLDEPTSHLDQSGRKELLDEISRLRHAGKTVLMISHRPEEVRRIADRVVTLESGRIVRDGSTPDSDAEFSEAAVFVERTRAREAVGTLQRAGIAARLDGIGSGDRATGAPDGAATAAAADQTAVEGTAR